MSLAIYVRVSTDQQVDSTSLDTQEEICRKKAYEMGYYDSNIKVYREEGSTGEDIEVRQAMPKLRQDIADGLISHIICTHPDRFSRDLTDKLIVMREFERFNAELIFTDTEVKKSAEGSLLFNILSVIASYELALIRKRTVRGRERSVKVDKKIMPMRVAPYGYDKTGDGGLRINPTESRYVRMIYEWYVFENLTMRQIGERLYHSGALPKRSSDVGNKNWSASSIGNILTSEIYIGKYYYNRRQYHKVRGQLTAAGNPKKKYEFRDEEDWIMVPIEAIIDDGLYEMAQKQKEKNTKHRSIGNPKYEYLLKSIIKCSHCGRTWDATTYSGRVDKETGKRMQYRCYRCPNQSPKRYGPEVEKCPSQSLRADMLEEHIWGLIVDLVTSPYDYVQQIKGQTNEGISEIEERVKLLKNELEMKEKEKDKVKIMFRRDKISEEEMDQDITQINKDIKYTMNEISKYQGQINSALKEELSLERINEIAQFIKNKLDQQDQLTFEFKRHIITMLFDEIYIRFDGEDITITSIGVYDKLQDIKNDVLLCTDPQKIRQYWRRSGGFD